MEQTIVLEKIKKIELLLNEIKEIEEINISLKEKSTYSFNIDKSKTFKNFIAGMYNNISATASLDVAHAPGKSGKYPTLFIHGSYGLGKTHLLHAIANEVGTHHPNLNVCLISAKNFMDEMITFLKNNRINEFVKKYTENVDVFLIDDIQNLKNKSGTQELFVSLFNEMHNLGKQLIFASDQRPMEIEGIADNVKSRLQWGLVVDIQPPELEDCVAILSHLAISLNMSLDSEILYQIAQSSPHNPRALESAILRIKYASELMNVEVDTEFVKEQLKLI